MTSPSTNWIMGKTTLPSPVWRPRSVLLSTRPTTPWQFTPSSFSTWASVYTGPITLLHDSTGEPAARTESMHGDYRSDATLPLVGAQFSQYSSWTRWRITRLSLIHISEPTRQAEISYAVFCL